MTHGADILDRNLTALKQTEPELAERIAQAEPAALAWSTSRSGSLVASIEHQGRNIGLASRYDPDREATRLISSVDLQKHAGVIVLGLGLGYHVTNVAAQLDDDSLMLVFEPDVALLRAVLERVDHTSWLGRLNVRLVDHTLDRAGLVRRIEPFARQIIQGTVLITHPPSRQRHGEKLVEFGKMVTDTMAYCRTQVATQLVNASRTISNFVACLPHYAGGANTNDLFNTAPGYPAVCVSAGPSLARNVHLLTDPEVRRNIVVITAQTTLKVLLDHGIEPDFVTALDYHEISRRFYDGLPELERVTLVAEPLANPMILDSFPGPIRVTQSAFLDRLLGDLAKPIVPIRYGATVSHLSVYVAQHLGCDPIILIGQDLGFSHGQYYCPGTAIHDVWAPELSRWNTLEMMEWQRVVRHRGNLRKLEDINDQAIYSDEQMMTYLKQFERDFAQAPQTILDATEGGLPKQHTTRITLADALQQYATREVPPMPIPSRTLDTDRLRQAADCVEQRIEEIRQIRELSHDTIPLLREILEHQRDQQRVDRLFTKLNKKKKRVEQLSDAFTLLNELNAVGRFNRDRSDRAILHDDEARVDVGQRQAQQLRRDLENLDWIIQACDEARVIFRNGLERLRQHKSTEERQATTRLQNDAKARIELTGAPT